MLRRAGKSLAVAVVGASGLWLVACDLLEHPRSEGDGAIATASEEWDQNTRFFVDAVFEARPHLAVVQGRHEYDGRLADYSAQGLNQWGETLRDERRKALGFDRSTLSRAQELERSNLLTQIDRELFRLETAAHPQSGASYYLEGMDPVVYVAREHAPAADRLRAYVRFAENVPEAARQVSVNLRGPLARVQLEAAAKTFESLADFLARDVGHTFSGVGEPPLQASFVRANEAARQALLALSADLSSRIPAAPDEGFALGGDVLSEMLWETERVAVEIEELEKAAEQELDLVSRALAEACEPVVTGGSIPGCLEELRSPSQGWSPLVAARRQVDEIARGLGTAGVVSIPPEAAVLVREALPHRNHEAALLEAPGQYEKGLAAVYRIALPSHSVDPETVSSPGEADLWLLTAREVFPGRLVQHLHTSRSPTELSRLFVGRGFSQGWAHYAEQVAFEEGLLPDTPAVDVAYLLSAARSAARMLAVVGLHADGWSLTQAEEMFRLRAFLSEEDSRVEASLAAVDPGRLHDTLGRLLILRLREDWFFEQGETASLLAFHDRFLSYGGPPIVGVKGEMVGNTGGSPF